ncbi:DUF559 domain-containing protein [Nocardia sp. NPDC003693]
MITTRAELRAEGVSADAIATRCRRGTYTRLLPGVYRRGPATPLDRCRAVSAWLPPAVLSHRTAAWLRGMLPEPPYLEATVPKSVYRKPPPWLRLHRRDIPIDQVSTTFDLPTTSPALTLLDCAATLPPLEAAALVDTQLGRTVSPADALALSRSTLTGTRALRKQLRDAAIHHASEPERLFARSLKARGLRLLANHPVGPYICDFVDERSRTIIEIDGREFHSAPPVFRQDRRRQNWLVLEGWMVLRYAAVDVFTALDECADQAAAVVRRRRRARR